MGLRPTHSDEEHAHRPVRGKQEAKSGVFFNGAVAQGTPILPTRMRMDKWLWAARFFKTRAIAAHACELGRIQSNGQAAKPSREVRIGDLLLVKNDSGDFQVEVLVLSEIRGPAAVAQKLYRETDQSRELRIKLAEERKAMPHFEASRAGKPSKKDRRELDRLRSR
jgi:ribosome-associated heat shock protein Hsp15